MLKNKVFGGKIGHFKPERIIRFYCLLFVATIIVGITIQPVMHVADFIWFYSVAKIAVHDSRLVYDIAALQHMIDQLIPAPRNFRFVFPFIFVYPPQSMFFFVPLTVFSLKTAYHVWTALNVLATLLFCRICSRQATNPPVSSLIILFMLSVSFPWLDTLWEGQPMIWMLLACMGSYVLAQRGRFFPAALLLCVCAFKPQLAIAPALYLCLLHGLPMLRAFFLAACLVIALVSLCYGWHIWIDYIHADAGMASNLYIYDLPMSNIRSLCRWLMPDKPELIEIITYVFFVISLLCTIAIGWLARNRSVELQDLGFALILPLSALSSPYLYQHSTILQAISVYFIYRYSGRAILYAVLAVNLLAFALMSGEPHHLPMMRLFIAAQFLLLLWSARLFLQRLSRAA